MYQAGYDLNRTYINLYGVTTGLPNVVCTGLAENKNMDLRVCSN